MSSETLAEGRRLAVIPGEACLTPLEASDFQALEAGTIPAEEFHHRQHVRMAWIYLRIFSPLEALERFPSALQRFARLNGKPDLYHETVTWAYLFLINERLRQEPGLSWEEFEARNPDLMQWKGGILEELYEQERLSSDLAKRVFVLPDYGVSRRVAEPQREAEE